MARTGAALKTSLDYWNGRPLLKIEGPFRPFRLSVHKAHALIQLLPKIQAFVDEHIANTTLPGPREPAAPTPEELAIISKYVENPLPTKIK